MNRGRFAAEDERKRPPRKAAGQSFDRFEMAMRGRVDILSGNSAPERGGASILREEPERSAAGRARQREGAARPSREFRLRAEMSVKGARVAFI